MSYRFKLNPMSPDWRARLAENNYLRETEMEHPDNEALKNYLLDGCGFAVCMPWIEEDVNKLRYRGQFWSGNRSLFWKGLSCQCHGNSARLWEQDSERFTICTGYAMSRDGVWRCHSWCIQFCDTEKQRIIETTERRLLYFGFTMTEDESSLFLYENP